MAALAHGHRRPSKSGTAEIHPTHPFAGRILKGRFGAGRVIANRKLNGGRKPKFKHEPLPSKEGLHSANIPTNLQDVIAPFFL